VSSIALSTGRRARAAAFADVLSYPHASPVPAALACADAARGSSQEAAALLEAFAGLAGHVPHGELQEEYTRTFDLDTLSRAQPTCYPYVGHYLFEESHKRGAFILGLKRRFAKAGFEDGSDLPDHLVVLLRFLAGRCDDDLADEIVADAMLPALARMALAATSGGATTEVRDAYLGILRALELVLRADCPQASEQAPEELELEREWMRNKDSLGIDRDWCGR
jgi:nitrate reductase assembly molybdenum cofactor insertion protein NarJ